MPYITSVEEIWLCPWFTGRRAARETVVDLTVIESACGRMQQRVEGMTIAQLEALGEALLDFEQLEDLLSWLETLGSVGQSAKSQTIFQALSIEEQDLLFSLVQKHRIADRRQAILQRSIEAQTAFETQ